MSTSRSTGRSVQDDLLPFYAGTYFPPESRYGRPGFGELLGALRQAWDNDRDRVRKSADQIAEAIRRSHTIETTDIEIKISPDRIESLVENLAQGAVTRLTESFDLVDGGFGQAPKFPRPSVLFFLLSTGATAEIEGDNPSPLDMVESTLTSLSNGGIHDHLGGGYARYSVDTEWRVPHFEKMLYDQAQLLEALARTHVQRPNPLFADRIESTIAYIDRDLKSPDGGFFSAEDADSEGEEGTFYVWRVAEIRELLEPAEAELLIEHYGLSKEGNFENGKNVLHVTVPIERLADLHDSTTTRIERRLSSARALLYKARGGRERPIRDEKIITAWNGLLLSGLAWSARALEDPGYYTRAESLASWIDANLCRDGDLYRRRVGDDLRYRGFLEDYGFVIRGLIDLYDTHQNPQWIRRALHFAERGIELFWSDDEGFSMTDRKETSLPLSSRSDHDGAEPSGSSAMAWSLARLGTLLDIERFREIAARTIVIHGESILSYPDVMPLLIMAGERLVAGGETIVIIESPSDRDGYKRLVDEARSISTSTTDLILQPATDPDSLFTDHLPYIAEMVPLDGMSVAYRCVDFTCGPPITTLEENEVNE